MNVDSVGASDKESEKPSSFLLNKNMNRAQTFGEDAQQYDRARPGYPVALIDDLLHGDPEVVLDVGSGTGIASRLLAARGCHVLCVEPDARMAAVGRIYGLRVEEASFEKWEPDSRLFDLLISAQAWHWVDPRLGSAKAATALKPDARIALFWNVGHLPLKLKGAFEEVYARISPGFGKDSILLGNAGERFETSARALQSTGAFQDVELKFFTESREYTTQQWVDQFHTHSEYRSLSLKQRLLLLEAIASIIDDEGGQFIMNYETVLVSGKRIQ